MKKILIVDDVYANRYIIEEIFKEYKVQSAADGEQMWKILEKDLPDVILMDVNLPDEDGFELTKKIKADSRTKDIPVLFLTVHNTKMDVKRAVEAGGVDFIVKPFDGNDVVRRVENILENKL